jgi:hypothetical protein
LRDDGLDAAIDTQKLLGRAGDWQSQQAFTELQCDANHASGTMRCARGQKIVPIQLGLSPHRFRHIHEPAQIFPVVLGRMDAQVK